VLAAPLKELMGNRRVMEMIATVCGGGVRFATFFGHEESVQVGADSLWVWSDGF